MDRNVYKSEEQLARQGWKAMRQALDREMPEERRPQPVLLFWILGLLLPTAGLLYWTMKQPAAPTGEPALTAPVAEAPRQAPPAGSHPEEAAMQPAQSATEVQPAINLTPAATGKGIAAAPAETTTAIQPAPGQVAAATKITQLAAPSKNQPPDLPLTQMQVTDNQSVLQTPANPLMAEAPVETNYNLLHPAELLPQIIPAPTSVSVENQSAPDIAVGPPTVTNNTAPLFPLPSIEPAAKSSPARWSIGASAGVLSDKNAGYAGSVAGLATEWQMNRKWGLRSGLSYQFQSLRESDRSLVSLSSSSYVNATGDIAVLTTSNGFAVSSTDPTSEPIFIAVSRIHRLEMPVLAYWQPVAQWRLFGGMAVGNTLYAQTGNHSLKANTVFTIQGGDATQNLNREITEQLRAWNLSWSAGLGFRPGRRFAIDLFVQNPLQFKRAPEPFQDQALPGNSADPEAVFRQLLSSGRTQTPGGRTQFQVSATVFF